MLACRDRLRLDRFPMKDTLTAGEARRIALAAQGFGGPREDPVDRRRLTKLVERLGAVQIDSVNVVSRTHYLPAFSRLGAYPRELLEELAWAKKRPMFEYWAHEPSLLPLASQPLSAGACRTRGTAWACGRASRGSGARTPTSS